MGYVETLHKNHLLLQANSIKHRAVLYYIYQGREVVDDDRYRPDAEGGFIFIAVYIYW
jgi:hypothetical protein